MLSLHELGANGKRRLCQRQLREAEFGTSWLSRSLLGKGKQAGKLSCTQVQTSCNRSCLRPKMPPLKVGHGNHLGSGESTDRKGVVALPVLMTLLPQCALQFTSASVCRLGCKLLFLSLKHELGPKAAAGSKTLFCGWHGPKGSKTTLVSLTDASSSSCETNWIQIPYQGCFPPSCCLQGNGISRF